MPARTTDKPLFPMEMSILAEIEWDFPDAEEDVNWKFLQEEGTFSHKEACEFILHIGNGSEDQHFGHVVHKMKEFGCADDFINAYLAAKNAGAMRVMFWS